MYLQLLHNHLHNWKAFIGIWCDFFVKDKQFVLHLEGECWILSVAIIDAAATTLCSISND